MRNVALLFTLFALSTGCSIQAGGELKTPLTAPAPVPTAPPVVTAMTFGSEVNVSSESNYSVTYSLGNSTNFEQSDSTTGYKVVLSVQGTVFVED